MKKVLSTDVAEVYRLKQVSKETEIFKYCPICQKEYLFAYWDFELEWYLYVNDHKSCLNCKVKSKVNIN